MSKSWAWLFLCLSSIACAQSTQISLDKCIFRTGDNPAWSNPNLDESGWTPGDKFTVDLYQPRFWVRCKVDLGIVRGLHDPAIQIFVPTAYEVYFDGRRIGSFGSMQSGNYSLDRIRTWSLPPLSAGAHGVLALRIPLRAIITSTDPPTLRLGSRSELIAFRNSLLLTVIQTNAGVVLCYTVIGAIGLALLGLFFSDRSRLEVLMLALACLMMALGRFCIFAAQAQVGTSALTLGLLSDIPDWVYAWTQVYFFFHIARRRMPAYLVIALAILLLLECVFLLEMVVPYSVAIWITAITNERNVRISYSVLGALIPAASALTAFLPIRRLSRDARVLAMFCSIWVITDLVWLVLATLESIPDIPNLFVRWYTQMLEARGVALIAIVVVLIALLLREQRRIAEDRAQLAGEMHAARNAQQFLISRQLPAIPRLHIRSEYHPSREVGGDFFQVLPLAEDGALVVIGDVAGKGMEAGMLAALIVGAIRTAVAFTTDPERILELLNERLQGRGLVTSLVLRVESDGSAKLVNAGHLPPLLNGKEIPVEGALPLGAAPGISFPVLRFKVAEGDALVLMTDGVVEAQNSKGELFGFDRIGDLLRNGSDGATLARAAQHFGQQDDITVLTLTFAPAEVLHA